MPAIIEEVNKNAQRAQLIFSLLNQITPEKLQNESQLLEQLDVLDDVISNISSSIDLNHEDINFRQNLVSLMQKSIEIWLRITQRSVIDFAEESKIWRVSIDNGRLRARSMERYLEMSKLPKNPRWREVKRTAYYLLSNLDLSASDKSMLENLLLELQG